LRQNHQQGDGAKSAENMNSNDNIDEQVGTIWLREIEDEMLQVSLEMSKLRGLSSVGHNLSSVPYLHTARRPEDWQTNSRCLLLREANYELCKPLELPFYKRDVKAIQTEALHQSCTAENISSQSEIQRVQLKPVLSKRVAVVAERGRGRGGGGRQRLRRRQGRDRVGKAGGEGGQ
jgi:hypothetical protein